MDLQKFNPFHKEPTTMEKVGTFLGDTAILALVGLAVVGEVVAQDQAERDRKVLAARRVADRLRVVKISTSLPVENYWDRLYSDYQRNCRFAPSRFHYLREGLSFKTFIREMGLEGEYRRAYLAGDVKRLRY